MKSHQKVIKKLSKVIKKLSKVIKSHQKLSVFSNRPENPTKPSEIRPITFQKLFENHPKITKSAGNYEIGRKLRKLTGNKKSSKSYQKVIKSYQKVIKSYQKSSKVICVFKSSRQSNKTF